MWQLSHTSQISIYCSSKIQNFSNMSKTKNDTISIYMCSLKTHLETQMCHHPQRKTIGMRSKTLLWKQIIMHCQMWYGWCKCLICTPIKNGPQRWVKLWGSHLDVPCSVWNPMILWWQQGTCNEEQDNRTRRKKKAYQGGGRK